MINIHTYKEAYTMTVFVGYQGNCNIKYESKYHIREVINKMACYNADDSFNLASKIHEMTGKNAGIVPSGAKLYVASECKTQRDIFRNSGYTIKLDPAAADVVVVPDIIPKKYHTRECNLVGTDQNDEFLFLVSIQKAGYSVGEEVTMDDVVKVRDYLINLRNYKFDVQFEPDLKVWFIPKSNELKEVMLDNKKVNVPYIQEHLVPISASTTISPETLMYWKSIAAQDQELLARTICTSNWRKYPFTLLAFLKTNETNKAWNLVGNSDFKNILHVIGYNQYCSTDGDLEDRNVSPKDYDMFQSYLYYLMGIDEEKGGVVDLRTLDSSVDSDLLEFLQRRMVFKPIHLSGMMRGDTIRELVK